MKKIKTLKGCTLRVNIQNNLLFKKKINKSLFFLVFTFLSLPLIAEENLSFKIGICNFKEPIVNNDSSTESILAVLYETISTIKEHKMSEEEINSYLINAKQKEINSEKKKLEDMYKTRDEIIFTKNKINWYSEFKSAELKINKQKDVINLLEQEIDTNLKDSTLISEKIPVEFKSPTNSMFFPKVKGDNESTAKELNLDAFLYGFTEEINEYTYLELHLWNNLLKKDTLVWRTALENDKTSKQLNPGIKLIKTALIGSPWAEISVKGPDDCMIFINDEFAGIESVNNKLLTPGKVEISVEKKGFNAFKQEIVLKDEESVNIPVVLTSFETKQFIIQAFPAGTDVYLDSKWVGTSPVKVSVDSEITSVQLQHEGFDESVFFIDENSDYYNKPVLNRTANRRDSFLKDKRMDFLNTFGVTLLSLPITAISYSIFTQTDQAYNNEMSINGTTNIEELYRLVGINNRQYDLFIFSLGLNIILFVDTIIQAVEYVNAVEYFSY